METGQIDTSVKCFSQSINKLHRSLSRYPINTRWSNLEVERERRKRDFIQSMYPPLADQNGQTAQIFSSSVRKRGRGYVDLIESRSLVFSKFFLQKSSVKLLLFLTGFILSKTVDWRYLGWMLKKNCMINSRELFRHLKDKQVYCCFVVWIWTWQLFTVGMDMTTFHCWHGHDDFSLLERYELLLK